MTISLDVVVRIRVDGRAPSGGGLGRGPLPSAVACHPQEADQETPLADPRGRVRPRLRRGHQLQIAKEDFPEE